MKGMSKPQRIDPFVSSEAEVKVDASTNRVLKQRVKSADDGRVVSAAAARQRIHRWLSKSSTSKTR